MNRPVLVTGAAGFAGSHLVDRLEAVLPPDAPILACRRPDGRRGAVGSGRATWLELPLLDEAAVADAIHRTRPCLIYHCAGSPHVASSWTDTLTPLESNVLSTANVLRAIERHSPDTRLLVPSSALVYDASAAALDENAPLLPRTPYGISKLAQELLAWRAHDRGVAVFIARPFNHVGPRQEPSFVTAAFARQLAQAEAGMAKPVLRVGNLDAERDLTDVRDTVRAYALITERGRPGRVYNVCSGRTWRVGDLLERLLSLARVRVQVEVDPARLRPSDVPRLLGSSTRIMREIDWQPEIPMEQTLADLLEYWRGRVAEAGVKS